MSRQTQGSMLLVGVLSGAFALAAFLIMMVIGGMAFSPALFLALLVGLGVAIFLFRAFHPRIAEPEATRAAHAEAVRRAAEAAKAPHPAPAAAAPAAPAAPAAAASAPAPEPAPEPAAAPEPAPAATADAPTRLDGPRGGKADDLKKIKGVGPKLEAMLNRMGFYHYDQVANWTTEEAAWVDDNLEGFKGRATRDNWIEQAKTLAAGGETEFSKKVDKGDVY